MHGVYNFMHKKGSKWNFDDFKQQKFKKFSTLVLRILHPPLTHGVITSCTKKVPNGILMTSSNKNSKNSLPLLYESFTLIVMNKKGDFRSNIVISNPNLMKTSLPTSFPKRF